MGPLKLRTRIEQWPLKAPFRISGHTWEHLDVLAVTLEGEGRVGHAEAAGVYYKNETPASMLRQLESVSPRVETGLTRERLQTLLPPGGARNALDCALWDLEAKVTGRPAWEIAGLEKPRPLMTTFTCGADSPERMAAAAKAYEGARALKLKLTGESLDADRVRAVRDARPDVWLGVDGNQGFSTATTLQKLMPVLVGAGVALIEQPFPIGQEALLDGLESPIPIAADESVQCLIDIASLAGRVQVMNIKLDKCGGLTEALEMVRAARELGLELMVGNMLGTSLAMAPAYVLGQLCRVVDLDGPVFLKTDREPPVRYANGLIECPEEVWGGMAEEK
jgi:L-alanine-DL-glutamate epimerase-like enolase superfamily enzyme